MSLEQRSQSFEIPSSLNIGASYDFLFAENKHRLTTAANFSSMAFSKDQYTLGLEYGFAKLFMMLTQVQQPFIQDLQQELQLSLQFKKQKMIKTELTYQLITLID